MFSQLSSTEELRTGNWRNAIDAAWTHSNVAITITASFITHTHTQPNTKYCHMKTSPLQYRVLQYWVLSQSCQQQDTWRFHQYSTGYCLDTVSHVSSGIHEDFTTMVWVLSQHRQQDTRRPPLQYWVLSQSCRQQDTWRLHHYGTGLSCSCYILQLTGGWLQFNSCQELHEWFVEKAKAKSTPGIVIMAKNRADGVFNKATTEMSHTSPKWQSVRFWQQQQQQ